MRATSHTAVALSAGLQLVVCTLLTTLVGFPNSAPPRAGSAEDRSATLGERPGGLVLRIVLLAVLGAHAALLATYTFALTQAVPQGSRTARAAIALHTEALSMASLWGAVAVVWALARARGTLLLAAARAYALMGLFSLVALGVLVADTLRTRPPPPPARPSARAVPP